MLGDIRQYQINKGMLEAYNNCPERTAVVPVASYHTASSFIRVCDAEVFRPAEKPHASVLEGALTIVEFWGETLFVRK